MGEQILNDPYMKQFVQAETQRQKFQQVVNNLTDDCWEVCMGTPSNRLDSKTENCMMNCVNRFIDSSNFIINRMEREGEAILSKQGQHAVDTEVLKDWGSSLKN